MIGYSGVAEMEVMDRKSSSICQSIIRVSDQLKAGELKFMEITQKEADEAKARLVEVRKKRRERHARKIIRN